MNNLNSCLGDKYLVTVSTILYEQAVKDSTAYQCNHCTTTVKKTINKGEENEYIKEVEIPTEILFSEVKPFELLVSLTDSILLGSKTKEVWVCPQCKSQNDMDLTDKIVPQNVNPFFLKIVWDCPIKKAGLGNRLGFHSAFEKWFNTFLEEINWQEVLYRKEYKAQNGFDMDDTDHKDNGDQK